MIKVGNAYILPPPVMNRIDAQNGPYSIFKVLYILFLVCHAVDAQLHSDPAFYFDAVYLPVFYALLLGFQIELSDLSIDA